MSSDPVGLRTVSLRLRVMVIVVSVLTVVLLLLGVVVDRVFVSQSERNLEALLSGRAQLAKQLARSGVGPQKIVNRVDVEGVRAHLILRSGRAYGLPAAAGDQVEARNVTLRGPGRINGARLTLSVDTALADRGHSTLRRTLIIGGLAALILSVGLVALALRFAFAPLRSMSTLAQEISGGRRGIRLSPTRPGTELGRTAKAFDEMLDELEGAETRARRAEDQSRAFLADAAHELRTPLAGVHAAAETLLQHGTTLSTPEREELQVLLIREAQRAGVLVSDLLTAARLDAGVELIFDRTAIHELVDTEVDRVRVQHPELSVAFTGSPIVLNVDRAKIISIVRNLIQNAVRAAGDGGRLGLELRSNGDRVELLVCDSGSGVPVDDRVRIFDRLLRLDPSRSADSGNSGLGLAIARGFARAHGGDLVCEEPVDGWGAAFRLTLPIPSRTAQRLQVT